MSASSRKDGSQRREPPTLSKLINDLNSKSTTKVYNALVYIRTKVVKEADGIARFRQHGGLDHLISVIQQTNQKVLDIGLSILGNCCCVEDQTRTKVLKCNGIDILANILKNVAVGSIQNRCCRTLANLAQNSLCRTEIHDKEGLVELIINLLKTCDEADCLQTYLRTIRQLSVTPSELATVIDLNGLESVAKHLASSDQSVVSAALKTSTCLLSGKITIFHIEQLVAAKAFDSLILLISDDSLITYSSACELTWKLIKVSDARPPFGTAGGISYLISKIQDKSETKEVLTLINALCLCCQEVVNRVKIRNEKGLQLLLRLLQDEKYSQIHDRIISALVCCVYDEEGLEILLKNSMVPVLLFHLKRVSGIDVNLESLDELSTRIKESKFKSDTASELSAEHSSTIESDANEVNFIKSNEPNENVTTYETVSNQSPCASKTSMCAVKYSIDSPTYKEIAESGISQNEIEDVNLGPMDFWQPDSPLSIRHSPASYHSPKCGDPYSPLSIASSYISPSVSPEYSPAYGRALYSPLSLPHSPAGSDLQSNSSRYSPIQTGFSCLEDDTLTNINVLHYSSAEDDSDDEITKNEAKVENEVDDPPLASDMICDGTVALKTDPIYIDPFSNSDSIGLALSIENDNRTEKAPKRRLQIKKQKKPRLSLEGREKVQKAIERNLSHSSLDLDDLLKDSHQKESRKRKKLNHFQTSERNIFILFSRISHMENTSDYIINLNFFITMAKYLIFGENYLERCSRILHRILRNPLHFTSVILNLIPSVVHEFLIKRYHLDDSGQEDKNVKRKILNDTEDIGLSLMSVMCLEAESAYGRGDINHLLMTGPEIHRQICAVALPFIIRSNKLLHRMLFETQGWLYLISLCQNETEFHTKAMLSLSHLTRRLNLDPVFKETENTGAKNDQPGPSENIAKDISTTCHNPPKKKMRTCETAQKSAEESNEIIKIPMKQTDIITFILENNKSISVSKSLLVKESDVFCAMLHGHYIESIQSSIKLLDVPYKAFEYCVLLLEKKDCKVYENDLSVLLEALVLVDQYMLHGCSYHVMEVISQHMSSKNIHHILQVALHHNAELLVKYCILFALTGDLNVSDRLHCTDILLNASVTEILKIIIAAKLMKTDLE